MTPTLPGPHDDGVTELTMLADHHRIHVLVPGSSRTATRSSASSAPAVQ